MGVEVGRYRLDGRLSTWFYGVTPDFELTLIGLDQPGGDNCRDLGPGVTLCEHTSYVAPADFDLIAASLTVPALPDVAPPRLTPIDPEVAATLSDLLEVN